MANEKGKRQEERPTEKIEFGYNYPAVFKVTATGLMSKVVAAHWLGKHESARGEIENAKTANEVRRIIEKTANESSDSKSKKG